MTLPAAVHIQYRPPRFPFPANLPAFHQHSDGDQKQSDHKNDGKNDIGKHPVIWIIMTCNQWLDKKNDDEDKTINGKDSPNDTDPIGNWFWHLHTGNDFRKFDLPGNLRKLFTDIEISMVEIFYKKPEILMFFTEPRFNISVPGI